MSGLIALTSLLKTCEVQNCTLSFSASNKTYDGFIAIVPCRSATSISLSPIKKTMVFITDFPCVPCLANVSKCQTVHSLHLALFPPCDVIVNMIEDVIATTKWTKITVIAKEILGYIYLYNEKLMVKNI